MKISILIPIYKENIDWNEEISLRQTFSVLNRYNIVIVCPYNINLSRYEELAKEKNIVFEVENFENSFFRNIASYNRLLLSELFYSRFEQNDYILICQPDAYVFEDRLEEWCEKGYDYIGAPLIGKFTETKYYPEMELRVGNGGFSLRKISTCLEYFNGNKNVFTSKQIIERINIWNKPYTRIFVWLLMVLGWRNKPKSVANNWMYNEDDFWSGVLDNSNYPMSKPNPIEALDFAFERFPSEMYNINGKLPFGCHAWEKYEYESFWKQFIK